MMSWLSALYTYSLQYQVNKNNVFYVQYWIFDNCYLSNYPAIRNIFGANQIIRYRYNEDPAITNNCFGMNFNLLEIGLLENVILW